MTPRDEIIAGLTSLGDKLPYFRFGQLVLACILPTKADDLWSVTDIDLLKGVRHFSELPYFQGPVESRNPARSDLVDFDLRQQFLGQLSSILALEPSLRFVQLLELLAWLARGS